MDGKRYSSIAAIVLFVVIMRRGAGMSCRGTGSYAKHPAGDPENTTRPAKTK